MFGTNAEINAATAIPTRKPTSISAVPLPDRHIHPLYVAATFEGRHTTQPATGGPARLEMVHALAGILASKGPGTWKLEFDQERWDDALDADSGRFRNMTYGTPSWALPR